MTRPTVESLMPSLLQLAHDLRQDAVGGRGCEHDHEFFAQVGEELQDAEPGHLQDQAENDENEDE